MTLRRTALPLFLLALCLLALGPFSLCQMESATLSGLITDPQAKVVPDVAVDVTNVDTNASVHQTTNGAGLYVIAGLKPGRYRVSFVKEGFRRIDLTDLVLNVQDVLSRNFQLQLGPVTASITVVAEEVKVNTESAAVRTVVDRNFVENMPLNGRSFQQLIDLTPGVVVTYANGNDPGQFSVNGQRASANYFTVDGVSANAGTTAGLWLMQSSGGQVPAFGVTGGTNTLVSVDAMQEFSIQTSTYAPEFGRQPGGQISIVTRSGTNQLHGTLFDYFRNDVLDANDWFNGFNLAAPLPKAKERQNDFGGVFGGAILRDHLFFFASYEGLRLRLPNTRLTVVPSPATRQAAPSAIQALLNAYPIPNGTLHPDGTADYTASFSDPTTINAASLRIDYAVSNKLTLFGRYNYAPSSTTARAQNNLADLTTSDLSNKTLTIGGSYALSAKLNNEFRFNYSRNRGAASDRLDTLGGAIPPLDSTLFPSFASSKDSEFLMLFANAPMTWISGSEGGNIQRQINIVDNMSLSEGTHRVKFGADYRRLSPIRKPYSYALAPIFSGLSGPGGADSGTPLVVVQGGARWKSDLHGGRAE